MTEFHAGLDEIATGKQISDGWTMCVLTESASTAFTSAVDAELASDPFHGRTFNAGDEKRYRRFLELLKQHAEVTGPSRLVFVLMDQLYRNDYVRFVRSVVGSALASVGIADAQLETALDKLAPGVGELLRHISDLGTANAVDITIDEDDDTRKLAAMTIPTGAGGSVTHRPFVTAIYEAFRKKSHPNAPVIRGMSAVPDESSRLVQAADVVGNFAMAYLFSKLTTVGKRRALKAKIFSDTFGESLESLQAASFGTVIGDDIQLSASGALVLRLVN